MIRPQNRRQLWGFIYAHFGIALPHRTFTEGHSSPFDFVADAFFSPGADVAAWDPFAPEASFHRAGSRREMHLDELIKDAEILAPMLPLTPNTRGLVTEAHIDALPKGCLVILATRAKICDVDAIRRRVMADEIALAADVFDMEPVPLDDPLLGRHNVVHTPHLAGRTIDANREWVKRLTDQFKPM